MRAARWSIVGLMLAGCSKPAEAPSPKTWPDVGQRWTDTSMMEVDWWRDLSWRVKATATGAGSPTVRAWMLVPDDEPDGSWADLTFGVVALEGSPTRIGSWFTRGWVGRSERAELSVARGPAFQDSPWVWVSERHSCDDRGGDQEAGTEYFFRIEVDGLAPVDQLIAIDPTQRCVKSIDTRFEAEAPLRLVVEADEETSRYAFDEASGFQFVPDR